MNPMFLLQLLCSLNALPGTSNLDQNPTLIDPQFLVQFNDMESFINGRLFIKGETCVDFSGDSSRDDFEDLFAEFDEETVEGTVDLVV